MEKDHNFIYSDEYKILEYKYPTKNVFKMQVQNT